MKRLNVLYVTLYLPIQNLHGGGNRMFEQLRYMSKRYDVSLLSFVRDWEEIGIRALGLMCKEVEVVRIKEKQLKSYSSIKPGFIRNYYSSEMEELIQKKLREIEFDVIQFEYLPMAQYKDGVNVKSVITEHQLGFLCLKKELLIERNILKRLVLLFRYNRLMRYETKALKKFDRVVFISKSEAEYVKDINPFVSTMGVDIEYFTSSGKQQEKSDLIYIGNFDNYQNVEAIRYFFKEIWPFIKKNRQETIIKIIGYKAKERLIFLENSENVRILGYVKDIRPHIDASRLFVLPAVTGGGMRGKVLEAMAMEKPIISTSIGIEGYDGDILKAIDVVDMPKDFADRTVRLLNNERVRREMGLIGRDIVRKEYTWEAIFKSMDKLYEELSKKN